LIDPWDLVSEVGSGPFTVTILDLEPIQQLLLLELRPSFFYKAVECRYFVARVRHEQPGLPELSSDIDVTCNLTRIPAEELGPGRNPFGLNLWRGGIGAIADLRLM